MNLWIARDNYGCKSCHLFAEEPVWDPMGNDGEGCWIPEVPREAYTKTLQIPCRGLGLKPGEVAKVKKIVSGVRFVDELKP